MFFFFLFLSTIFFNMYFGEVTQLTVIKQLSMYINMAAHISASTCNTYTSFSYKQLSLTHYIKLRTLFYFFFPSISYSLCSYQCLRIVCMCAVAHMYFHALFTYYYYLFFKFRSFISLPLQFLVEVLFNFFYSVFQCCMSRLLSILRL